MERYGTGSEYGYLFKITDYGRETAREIVLQQQEQMEQVQQQEGREGVFIIHGHDEAFKWEVSEFIAEIGLQPIILHEIADRGRTIIKKLEDEAPKAKFAVALWTPDDAMQEGNSRARQNVILETGMFCMSLSRVGVRILVKGEVEIPSDLDGVLRTHVDAEGKWKKELVRELRAAGVTTR